MTITEPAVFTAPPLPAEATATTEPSVKRSYAGLASGVPLYVALAGAGAGIYLNTVQFSLPLLMWGAGIWMVLTFIVTVVRTRRSM